MLFFWIFIASMTGIENIPIPSITNGDYRNHIFTEAQRTPICSRIRLFHCVFKNFRNDNPGGSFLVRDTTVMAESTVWSSIVGVCGQGMMIEVSSKCLAQGYLNNCTFTNCSNFLEAKGGALAIFGGAKCCCTDCQIKGNKAGGIFVFGSMWLKGSDICENSGDFGGISMTGEFVLSLTLCQFEGNRGLFEGFCVHIVSRIIFESDDCIFKNCISSSIYFEVNPKSVRFGCNSFKGYGMAICSNERIKLIVTGFLCFEGFKLSLPNNILFEVVGLGVIQQNCSSCNEQFDDDRMEKDKMRLNGDNEMKIGIECDHQPLRGKYCNCDFLKRHEMRYELRLLNCTFQNLN
jgi:hypothetical protein